MKIDDQQKITLWHAVKAFRNYTLRPYNEVEKIRDLKNLRLHEEAIKNNDSTIIFNICCVKLIKQRLEKYED